MKMHPTLGWPIVNSNDCFDTIRSLGIRPWPKLQEEEPLDLYLTHATDTEKDEVKRFGPKVGVVRHQNPHDGQPFNGFRVNFKPVATVFALIDDRYIPVTAEWKHGNNRITIVPPSGIPGKAENGIIDFTEKMRAVALREWQEETGIKLATIEPLTPNDGLWTVVRNADIHYSLFLGRVKTPIIKGPTKFDSTEHLKMVLFHIGEWMALIHTPEYWNRHPDFGLEQCAVEATLLGLIRLGRLSF